MNREEINQLWMKLAYGGTRKGEGYRQVLFSEEELDYLRKLIPEEELD